jgi:hypothetical protein
MGIRCALIASAMELKYVFPPEPDKIFSYVLLIALQSWQFMHLMDGIT